MPGEARSRRPGCRSHFGCPRWSCGSHLACVARASPGPGEAQEGFAQLEAALPSRLDNSPVRAQEDYYATSPMFSDAQVLELRAYLTLCPKHPQASDWRAGIRLTAVADKAAKDADTAKRNGTLVEDGTTRSQQRCGAEPG